MEIKQMKYEKQTTQEEHIKDNILLLKTIKDIEVMSGFCGWPVVYMIGYIINRLGKLYAEKKNTHAWLKKMHIMEHLDPKRENLLQLCI